MKSGFFARSLMLTVVLAFGYGSAQAADPNSTQPGNHQRRSAAQWMQQIGDKLNLTADQKTAITAILTKAAADGKAVRQDKSLSKEQKQARIKSIHQTAREQIKAVLTPQQRAQLAQMIKAHKKA
jgi:Spy/CpxP family protein refolding chaperone